LLNSRGLMEVKLNGRLSHTTQSACCLLIGKSLALDIFARTKTAALLSFHSSFTSRRMQSRNRRMPLQHMERIVFRLPATSLDLSGTIRPTK
jgi:hypothetical protein